MDIATIIGIVLGLGLIVGAIMMMNNRATDRGENIGKGSYYDWSLLILVLCLGLTGMLSQFTRLFDWRYIAYPMYFTHLVFVFCLFAYLPYSKLAHLVYRTLAMAYSRYSEREPCD